MNEMLPSADPSKLRGQKAAKKSRIRAIDQGTRYDITGCMRKTVRQIERGEYGKVKRVLCILLTDDASEGQDPGLAVRLMGWGGGGSAFIDNYMIDRAKDRVIA